MKQIAIVALLVFASLNCATAPKSSDDRAALSSDVQSTLKRLSITDESIGKFLAQSYGYVVFPTVGKGAFVVGGSYGRGEVFEQGTMVGYADISQATIGLQAGGQAFTEVIAFEDKASVERFKASQLK